MAEGLIFKKGKKGRAGVMLPECDVKKKDIKDIIPSNMLGNEDYEFPELSEVEVVRHFTRLSKLNFSVDTNFYPLGSCTMKYNPKVNEACASFSGFTDIHPYQDEESIQGALKILYETERFLGEIAGLDKVTLQPAAGAHGELTALMLIKAYFRKKREDSTRTKIIIPDSAHGTNPASAAICGFKVVQVPSNEKGMVDINKLKELTDGSVAGFMLTNPNTLGLFEEQVCSIAEVIHKVGAFMYLDGANLNAILGKVRPGDMGFDVIHYNLHKTFSTPHGGGGPGAGPVGVKKELAPFLPVPRVVKKGAKYSLDYNLPDTIGKVRAFYGNFNVVLKAYCYIRMLGAEGFLQVAENSVLNANYLKESLKDIYHLPYDQACMHEFVLSGIKQKKKGVRTLDIAKRLIDYGFHPPTIYFPLIVEEALMIEPTETETKETLDAFIDALRSIANEVDRSPEKVLNAPHTTPVKRLDEVTAARNPKLRWKK